MIKYIFTYFPKLIRPYLLEISKISDRLPVSYKATPTTAIIDAYMRMAWNNRYKKKSSIICVGTYIMQLI